MAIAVRKESDGTFCIENEFWRFRHDPKHGGELIEASVLHGSGVNLLKAPQSCAVALREGNEFHVFSTGKQEAADFQIREERDGVALSFRAVPHDDTGAALNGVSFQHEIFYSGNGTARHLVTLRAARKIENPGQIQIPGGKRISQRKFQRFHTAAEQQHRQRQMSGQQ